MDSLSHYIAELKIRDSFEIGISIDIIDMVYPNKNDGDLTIKFLGFNNDMTNFRLWQKESVNCPPGPHYFGQDDYLGPVSRPCARYIEVTGYVSKWLEELEKPEVMARFWGRMTASAVELFYSAPCGDNPHPIMDEHSIGDAHKFGFHEIEINGVEKQLQLADRLANKHIARMGWLAANVDLKWMQREHALHEVKDEEVINLITAYNKTLNMTLESLDEWEKQGEADAETSLEKATAQAENNSTGYKNMPVRSGDPRVKNTIVRHQGGGASSSTGRGKSLTRIKEILTGLSLKKKIKIITPLMRRLLYISRLLINDIMCGIGDRYPEVHPAKLGTTAPAKPPTTTERVANYADLLNNVNKNSFAGLVRAAATATKETLDGVRKEFYEFSLDQDPVTLRQYLTKNNYKLHPCQEIPAATNTPVTALLNNLRARHSVVPDREKTNDADNLCVSENYNTIMDYIFINHFRGDRSVEGGWSNSLSFLEEQKMPEYQDFKKSSHEDKFIDLLGKKIVDSMYEFKVDFPFEFLPIYTVRLDGFLSAYCHPSPNPDPEIIGAKIYIDNISTAAMATPNQNEICIVLKHLYILAYVVDFVHDFTMPKRKKYVKGHATRVVAYWGEIFWHHAGSKAMVAVATLKGAADAWAATQPDHAAAAAVATAQSLGKQLEALEAGTNIENKMLEIIQTAYDIFGIFELCTKITPYDDGYDEKTIIINNAAESIPKWKKHKENVWCTIGSILDSQSSCGGCFDFNNINEDKIDFTYKDHTGATQFIKGLYKGGGGMDASRIYI